MRNRRLRAFLFSFVISSILICFDHDEKKMMSSSQLNKIFTTVDPAVEKTFYFNFNHSDKFLVPTWDLNNTHIASQNTKSWLPEWYFFKILSHLTTVFYGANTLYSPLW